MPSANTAKTVVIHQPDFMPYPGFFHRLLVADLYVVLDHVQFLHNSKSWHHRDLIKSPQGAAWLTVSVKKAPRSTAIGAIELADHVDWRRRHLDLITHHYRHAPYFAEIYPYIQNLYDIKCHKLIDFNLSSILMLMDLFDIQVDIVLSSELKSKGKGCELLVDILQKVEATHYLSGTGARDYYRPEIFKEARITVLWQNYKSPVYQQLFGKFVPDLSSLDMLFNCGIKISRNLLRKISCKKD